MLAERRELRSRNRFPEGDWNAMLRRVRSEFDEMPCLRVTPDQARVLFGLAGPISEPILRRLADEGFLAQTPDGQYVRRNTAP